MARLEGGVEREEEEEEEEWGGEGGEKEQAGDDWEDCGRSLFLLDEEGG